jgi:hypothetical protein
LDIAAPVRAVCWTVDVISEVAAFDASVEYSGLTAGRDSVPADLPITVTAAAKVRSVVHICYPQIIARSEGITVLEYQ